MGFVKDLRGNESEELEMKKHDWSIKVRGKRKERRGGDFF